MTRLCPNQPVALALCMATLSGCAHSGASRPARLAVLPLDGVGLPGRNADRLRNAVVDQAARLGVPVVAVNRVDEVARSVPECGRPAKESWVPCGVAAGHRIEASHVVVGAAGGLGSTYVMQLKLIAVAEKAVTRAVEETVFGQPVALESIVPRVTRRLFDVPAPRWYERWWVWTIVGAAVATAAVAIPLALSGGDSIETHRLP